MRPHKTIYLYCQDEVRRSVVRLVLKTWGFCVITDLSLGAIPDVALIVNDQDAYDLVQQLDRDHPELRIVVLIKRRHLLKFDVTIGALMLDDKAPMIELREHIRTGAARKRGPKLCRVVAQEAAMEVVA